MKKTVHENRFVNFETLIEEAGSVAKLARRCGYDKAAYLYQVRAKLERPNGQILVVGNRMAAKLEQGMNRPAGWMDYDHTDPESVAEFEKMLAKQPKVPAKKAASKAPAKQDGTIADGIQTVTLAFTGASGMPYGMRLLEELLAAGKTVWLLYSQAAQIVAQQEMGFQLPSSTQEAQKILCEKFAVQPERLQVFAQENWFAPMASGTNTADAMIICPASMGTIAAVAHGLSDNLTERAADVAIKERRPVIIVPRETPFSTIHLENMLKLAQAGCTILPPSAGFYTHPQTIDDMVNFVVARVLDQLHIAHNLLPKWGE
ncbi:polyprenyl P-hydroxybenzoate and phenylacrylic acid decarboxylases [Alysiella filiformis DSM 16848]|uniref:Flavin prenyltransferase UbiX n=2 Tax=Alysiella TaxID=194195 RepID=A0A286EFQ1_9NEIS|nr:flavin prenyltransferase UbiX [Alysiella filiformis]QMT30489.1 UbiX family flavin prenyltransferase [Alysiella filiformis]SOD69756.1 polyprenyl P-hydroxybenzoate and phenylacrylic acid decarboxylases [Alysiella filiformis DSM 16848]